MKTHQFLFRLTAMFLAFGLPGCAFFGGGDKPEPPTELEAFTATLAPQKLWSSNIGEGTKKRYLKLTPVVAYGKVFAAGIAGRVAAYDAASGARLWATETKAPVTGGPGAGEGMVFVGTSKGEVIALDAESGAERWRGQASSEVLSAPRADAGVVVVRTVDDRLFGLDASNGERLWTHEFSVPVLTLRGTGAPVLARGLAIAGFASGKLAAVSLRDGRLLWETQVAIPRGRSELERMVDIDADPLVSDGVVHAVSYQGNIATVELSSGQVYWRRDMSSHAGLGMDSRQLYVTDEESQVWALDRRSGAALWKQENLRARAVTAPVAHAGYVVVGDLEGYLHWLERADGGFAGRIRVANESILAPPVVVDDTLYVVTSNGVLAAYRIQ